MSWKMFWQIVLLIIIASLVLGATEYGMKTAMWKCGPMHNRMMEMKGGRMMPRPPMGPSQQEAPQK